MSSPDWKARDKDRDAAIKAVEAALVDGQIVQADRDHRVEALLRAETGSEVKMLVHDLRLPAPDQYPDPYAAAADYPTGQIVGSARTRSSMTGILTAVALMVALGAGVLAAVGGIVTSGGSESGSSNSPLPAAVPVDDVNVLSEAGYRDLVRAVKKSTGSGDAFEAVLYPGYAVLTLPVDRSSQREDRWYWDGELESLDSKGTSSYERFDLASLDAGVVVRLMKRVRKLVDEPTSWYAIVRAPDPDDGAAMWVYASNEFSESAYLSAKRDGTVVYNSTKP